MKRISLLIFLILFSCSFITANTELTYRINPDKKFYKQFYKRVHWTDSFIIAYVDEKEVRVYKHKSSLDKVYDIASVSKTFTALIILQLHEQGRLNIDYPVRRYVTFYDPNVTVRHLLTHSAFRPYGKSTSYSNVNYILLKDIIEAITGNSYAYEVRKRFFEPLGMKGSDAKFSNGSGNIMSTMRDLSRYTRMLMGKGQFQGKTIISEKIYNMLLEAPLERERMNWFFSTGGYEVFTKKDKVTSFYKSGRWYYSVSGIEIFPDKKKAVIYIGNPKFCLSPSVKRWRNWFWRFIRKKVDIQ